jgi:hypothetical protein
MFRVLTRYQLERSIARDNVVTGCLHNIMTQNCTALHLACSKAHASTAQLLLLNGASDTIRNSVRRLVAVLWCSGALDTE